MSSASTSFPIPPKADPGAGADAGLHAEDEDQRPLWLVVRSEGRRLGIPIAQVKEVVRPTGLRRVPGTPPVQAGMVNVRGSIVTVLDLAAAASPDQNAQPVGWAGRAGAQVATRAVTAGSIVLLQYGSRPIGIAVDGVEDVAVVEEPTSDDARAVHPFDAVAWCARHLHSAEERER